MKYVLIYIIFTSIDIVIPMQGQITFNNLKACHMELNDISSEYKKTHSEVAYIKCINKETGEAE